MCGNSLKTPHKKEGFLFAGNLLFLSGGFYCKNAGQRHSDREEQRFADIVGDHAAPYGGEAEMEHFHAKEGTQDPDPPHTHAIDNQRHSGFAGAVVQPFHNDRYAEKRLR